MSLDLVVLVSDKDVEQACLGILGRHRSLRIRPITHQMLAHPHKDPGCFHSGHEVLAPFARAVDHALVVFDRAWEGAPDDDAERLASMVEGRLRSSWDDRARCIVIDPEVETWVWSNSPHVAEALGWRNRTPHLRRHLELAGLWPRTTPKPTDPKRALDSALRAAKQTRSSAVFRRIGDRVNLDRCADASFQKLVGILREWFGSEQ